MHCLGALRQAYMDADVFSVEWDERHVPDPAPADTARLLAATLMINQLFFEGLFRLDDPVKDGGQKS